MTAEYFVRALSVADYCSKRQVLKEVVDRLEHTSWLVNILAQTVFTFLTKSKVSVHLGILMVTSYHKEMVVVPYLECHKQAYCLQGEFSPVNEVAQEDISIIFNVSSLRRVIPDIKEAHKIYKVSMQVSKYFHRCLNILDNDGLT